MIKLTTVSSSEELHQILDLQKINVESSLESTEVKSQGFVTVHHDFELIEALNKPYPHIIAKDGNKVIGYALVMLQRFKTEIPVLVSMFEQIDQIEFNGKLLKEVDYFIMGQVCIDKGYRGQGIFVKLYQKMKEEMSDKFPCIITEVASRNTRSIAAHRKAGFKNVKEYTSENGEDWVILLWDWS